MTDDNRKQNTLSASADELKKPPKQRRGGNRGKAVLIGLLAVVLLAAAAMGIPAIARHFEKPVEISIGNVWLTNRGQDAVQSIQIDTRDGVDITLLRDGEGFSAPQIAPQMLSQDSCRTAFINAGELLAEKELESSEGEDADFGFAPPASVVAIDFYDGERFVLEIGDKAPGSNLYYAREAGGEAVYLIKGLLVNLFAGGIDAFWDVANFSVDSTDAIGLTYAREGAPEVALEYAKKPVGFRFTTWHMTAPFIADVITSEAEDILAAMNDMTFDRYVATTEELAQYGLDQPSDMLVLHNASGEDFMLQVGGRDARGNAYVRLGDSLDVYYVRAESLAYLDRISPVYLVSEFSNIHAITNLSELTVQIGERSATFSVDRSGDEPVFSMGGRPVDAQAFKDAYQAINQILIADFADERSVADGARCALKLTYAFTDGEGGVVEYLESGVYHYALRKNGSIGVGILRDAAEPMIAQWQALMDAGAR